MPAVVFALAQPLPSRVDEAQHADVLAEYAAGVYPVEGATVLRPEIVQVLGSTGVFRWNLPWTRPLPAEQDPAAFAQPPPSVTPAARSLWMRRHLWGFSYEAMQPPLYYVLAEPAWLAGSAAGGATGGFIAARLFSAAIAALLAPLIFLFVRELEPRRSGPALLATAVAVLWPGFQLNATQVTNDGLAAVLSAACLLALARGVRQGWSLRRWALAGLLLGAACLAKLTAVVLAPFSLLALLLPSPDPPGRRLKGGLVAGGVAAAVVAPWLAVNQLLYGHPLPGAAATALLASYFPVHRPGLDWLGSSLWNGFTTFWSGEPVGTLAGSWLLTCLAAGWGLLAAIGLARRGAERPPLLPLTVAAVGFGLAWSLALPWISHVGGYLPGRYLYPLAPMILGLYAAGTWRLPPKLATAALGLTGVVAVVTSALFLTGTPGEVAHRSNPPPGLPGQPVAAQSDYHGMEVKVDRVLVEAGGREAYVHLTATNNSSARVEWNPLPYDHTDGRNGFSDDYAGSSPFPEALAPSTSYTGWLHLRRPAGGPVPYLQLNFPDVATDGYANVGTIDVWVWSVATG